MQQYLFVHSGLFDIFILFLAVIKKKNAKKTLTPIFFYFKKLASCWKIVSHTTFSAKNKKS